MFALLPPVYLVWGNAHGGVVTGLGFLGVASVCALPKSPRLATAGILALMVSSTALLVNPYGPGFLEFLLHAVSMERPMITEWGKPRLTDPSNALLWIHLAFAAVAVCTPRSRTPLEGRAYLLLSAYQALQHERLVPLFTLTSAVYALPLFCDVVGSLRARWPDRLMAWEVSGKLALGCLCLCSLLYALRVLAIIPGWRYSAHGYPQGAIDWLKHHYEGGKVMVGFNHGSFALWRLPLTFKVSIDGRYEEVYPEEVFLTAYRAYQIGFPGQPEALRDLNPDFIIFSMGTPEEILRTQCAGEFVERYTDGSYGVLARKSLGEPRAGVQEKPEHSVLQPGF